MLNLSFNMNYKLFKDTRHMGPTALRIYDLFSEYGVELREEERNRLKTAIEKHSSLSK